MMQSSTKERVQTANSYSKGKSVPTVNFEIAKNLREFAELLEQQGADGFREQAYRNAADYVSQLVTPLSTVLEKKGRSGLIDLPSIGKSIASFISEVLLTGQSSQLNRLRGELLPEKLFQTIPGIGPKLASRLAEYEHLETLDDLETEINLGKLKIPGLGTRRRQMISAALSQRLGQPLFNIGRELDKQPSRRLILEVDEMYRERAAKGRLKMIAPKRFNPEKKQWLPIMHARHDEWHFTALFSNSMLAHKLGKTKDWVIIYFHTTGQREDQCTVITASKGERVVRGLDHALPVAMDRTNGLDQ